MDSPALSRYDFEEMCKSNSRGKKKGNERQQVTSDEFWRARGRKRGRQPCWVTKYNFQSYHLLGVRCWRSCCNPQTTPRLVYRWEAQGGVGWFHQQKRQPEWAIHSHPNVQVHLGAGQIRRRVNGITYKRVVLATGPGNPPAVQVRTAESVKFSSSPIWKPDPLNLCRPNPDPHPSTHAFCRVWLDPSVRISGSGFRAILFMVAFRYRIANRKMLTLIYRCPFLMFWPPL